jgi:hypothetical protein
MRPRAALLLAGLALLLATGTLAAQELPMDTPSDQDSGPRIVNPDPTVLMLSAPDDLVQMVRADAAQRLGTDAASVQIAASQPMEWSNASLGCPRRESVFAQVITPGFLIVVDVDGNRLTYHTDTGTNFVVCEGGRPLLDNPGI